MKEVVVFKVLGGKSHCILPTANIDYIMTNCREKPDSEVGAVVVMKSGAELYVGAPTNMDLFLEQLVGGR